MQTQEIGILSYDHPSFSLCSLQMRFVIFAK